MLCENGHDALFYLKANLPDIIISDLMMPVMGGRNYFKKLEKAFNTIPFVIITASIDDETKFKQLENGVNDYIMKPFKKEVSA
jgi:DNA-binding response OmpR family regulator